MVSRVNVEVTKTINESNASLVRRFTKRLQGSGILKQARAQRFILRPPSKLRKKEGALKRIAKRKEIEKLKKLGRIV